MKKIITTEYEVSESFSGISVDLTTASLSIVPADGEVAKIKCGATKNVSLLVKVSIGTLSLTLSAGEKWYHRIFSRAPRVEISLPKAAYESLYVNIKAGDVTISGISAKSIGISAVTGGISVSDVFFDSSIKLGLKTGSICAANSRCRSLDATASSGVITLDGVLVEENLRLKISAGTINLRGSDASTSSITAKAGFINGKLLSYE